MRESRTYGSVRGARGDARPYRDRRSAPRKDIGVRPPVIARSASDEATSRPSRIFVEIAWLPALLAH
jgi:hypothetical protein